MPIRRVLRKTKVVATIGPACDSVEKIRKLIEAGMNVARLNFSHGTHEQHLKTLERIRAAAGELSANTAVMLDTRGVEIRTGPVDQGRVPLVDGQTFALYAQERPGTAEGVSVSYADLPREVRLGSAILLDDGRIELRIQSLTDDEIRCEVVRGGELGSHKGLNVPDATLTPEVVGPDDHGELQFAVDNDVDYIAASFVRCADDIHKMRAFIEERGGRIPLIAKIENREGVANLDEIVEVADGTMVARGDLGVDLPVQDVPLVQKRIIRTTVMAGKPVITATQMLDSMERNARPTRAEASDVANAILDGTSAVMLSGETAMGKYPVEAVRTMSSIAIRAEASLHEYGDLQQIRPNPANVVTEAVAQASTDMANRLNVAAILTLTERGFTSRAISKYRPKCPIIALTSAPEVVRKLAMNWGVTAILVDSDGSDEGKILSGLDRCLKEGYVLPGDVVVATAGISRETGSTNLIRVVNVGDDSGVA